MKKRTIVVIVVIILLVAAALVGFRFFGSRLMQNRAQDAGIETEKISAGEVTLSIGETGTVRPGQSAVMSWKTSGTVEVVGVDILDEVNKGETLAALAFNSLSQNVIQAQSDLISAQEQLDDLYRNFDKDQAEAQLAVIRAQEELDELLKDRDWLNYPRCGQDTIEDYQDEYQNALDRVADLEGRYDANPDNSFIRDQLINARKTRDTAFANYNYCISPREESEINEADTEIALAQAKLDLAEADYQTFETGEPDENDVTTLQLRIEAAKATLELAKITAPFSGTITALDAQPGDQVGTGVSALRIDDLSQLHVDLEISEIDINSIKVGQDVIYRFDAIPDQEYHGVVTEIASVGSAAQGVVEFKVTTQLLDGDKSIKPGMTAIAEITIEQLTEALLVPNQAVRVLDGQRVVYVLLGDGTTEKREIELGVQSTFYSQVTEGDLEAGDRVVLNPNEEMESFQPGGGSPMGGMFGRGN